MITIQSGKLSIPEDERFIGFAGDNSVIEKQILVLHRHVLNSAYTLCLRFDNGDIKQVPLPYQQINSDVLLTWTVEREEILHHGIVTAQVKMTDDNGNIQHSSKDYFLIGSSVEIDEDGFEKDYITQTQLEEKINEAVEGINARSPYLGSDGYWYVYDKAREEFIKTGYRGDLSVDSSMDINSPNPVENGTVTMYVSGLFSELREEIGNIENALATV